MLTNMNKNYLKIIPLAFFPLKGFFHGFKSDRNKVFILGFIIQKEPQIIKKVIKCKMIDQTFLFFGNVLNFREFFVNLARKFNG